MSLLNIQYLNIQYNKHVVRGADGISWFKQGSK